MKTSTTFQSNRLSSGIYHLFPLLFLILVSAVSFGQSKDEAKEYFGEQAQELIPEARYLKYKASSTVPSYVKFQSEKGIPHSRIFDWMTSSFQLSKDIQFDLLDSTADSLGMIHYRYKPSFQGIPIEFSWYMVHVKRENVYKLNGSMEADYKVNTAPSISESSALEKALEFVGAETYRWEMPEEEAFLKSSTNNDSSSFYPIGKLVIVDSDLANAMQDENYRLAWKFEIKEATGLKDQAVYVDAVSGEVVQHLPITFHCDGGTAATTWHGNRTIQTDDINAGLPGPPPPLYILHDDCGGPEVLTIQEAGNANYTDLDNNWVEAGATGPATSHFYGRETLDYFAAVHGRNGYDNAGGNFTIKHRANYANAFYDGGGRIVLGDGNDGGQDNEFYNTLDVVGHEFTHGLIDFEANLVYQGEPGALNESFADIFGENIERRTENNLNIDWLHREDYYNGNNRSFIAPKDKGDPDTYNGTNWASTCGACPDNGGVHTNSGVQNHWYYLLTDGGSGTNDNGDDYTVSGIGLNKARSIAYRNLSMELGVNSDYSDARTGAIAAAEDLYGACSNEVKSVMDAWYAVGVGDPFLTVVATVTSNYNGRNISCNGENDGAASAAGSFGTPPYTYLWSTGAVTASISNLTAGNYTVTVTDASGCKASATVTLVDPPKLFANITKGPGYNGWDISCKGACDGSAKVFPDGGTGPYTYLWSVSAGSQATQEATNLCAGLHSVTITDVNGCKASANVTLLEPPKLFAAIEKGPGYNGWDISCAGNCDGVAKAIPDGGTGPYTYLWSVSAGSQLTQQVNNLCAGLHSVTITDVNGCVDSVSVTLSEPPPLEIEAGPNQTVFFYDPTLACTDLEATGMAGGVPPYTLSWSSGGNMAVENVCLGAISDSVTTERYYVTITDLNGCTKTDSVDVCYVDIRCGDGDNTKVIICHKPNDNAKTLCISLNALSAHLAHGDHVAWCGFVSPCDEGKSLNGMNALDEQTLIKGALTSETLLSAFPNPFADQTTIRFITAEDALVQVNLYDVSGRVIANLFNGHTLAGKVNDVTLKRGQLTKGIYFVQLITDSGEQQQMKLIMN